MVATNGGGTVKGEDMTFTTTTAASLDGLVVGGGALVPGFSRANASYTVTVPSATTTVTLTPVTAMPQPR